MSRCLPSLSPSRSLTHLPAGKRRGRQDQETQTKCLVEMLINKQTHTLSYYDRSSQRIMKHISKAYLCYVCLLIDGHKDFVQKRFKVITLDPVHDKPFQWGHWKTQTVTNNCSPTLQTQNCFRSLLFKYTTVLCKRVDWPPHFPHWPHTASTMLRSELWEGQSMPDCVSQCVFFYAAMNLLDWHCHTEK